MKPQSFTNKQLKPELRAFVSAMQQNMGDKSSNEKAKEHAKNFDNARPMAEAIAAKLMKGEKIDMAQIKKELEK